MGSPHVFANYPPNTMPSPHHLPLPFPGRPLIPQVVDQPYWARRVTEMGIGAGHDGPTPTAESLSAALRTALGPETRDRANQAG
jgi:hypothetical protein